MTLIEFIGFIITMIAFFLLIIKQAWDQKRRREHPEQYQEEFEDQQAEIKEILESLNLQVPKEVLERREMPSSAALPPSPPKAKQKHSEEITTLEEDERIIAERREKARVGAAKALSLIHPKTEGSLFRDVHKRSAAEESIREGAYKEQKLQQELVLNTLADLDSLKRSVILKELLGPPKGLQRSDERF